MSIKRRIWTLPVVSAVIFGIGLAVTVFFSSSAINAIKSTEKVDYPVLENVKSLQTGVKGVVDTLKQAVGEGDKKGIDVANEKSKHVRELIKRLGSIPGQQKLAQKLGQEFDDYYTPATKVARIMMGMEEADPQPFINPMQSALKVIEEDLVTAVSNAEKQFESGVETSRNNVRNVLYTSILVAAVVILTLGGVSWYVVRSIWQQLGGEPEYARDIARAVADGELNMEIVTTEGDTESLLAALNEMRDRLKNMVSDIKISADTIKVASTEIAQGNSDLSSRTDSQASSLEETSSAMATLSDTVKQNAESAGLANQMVDKAAAVATRGGEVVSQVVTTMADINNSSNKIVDIISVIDGIAFQTNILALNAAVEAARAGEQGRGFAVVASEVRSLAQRSATAAREIKSLISDSVDKVRAGSTLVDQAGDTMNEIVASVAQVRGIMSEISNASQEQSAGILEISETIGHMDSITQQNATLVQEAASASASLEEQADKLMEFLSVFKLDETTTSAPQSYRASDNSYRERPLQIESY